MKKKIRLKMLLAIIITIIVIIAIINIFIQNKITQFTMSPELSRTQAYADVLPGDENVFDENGNKITQIQFDAFFLKDKDGDGKAETIRGTCNQIGQEANLFMELKVIEQGKLKDATITINANNFYFNTAIVKDNVIAENYISSNTKTIKLNDMENGSQAFLTGSVRAGDYSSSYTKTSAIGNDTSKYSMENSITFSGIYVDSNGEETKFTKNIPITVDWYGEVDCKITPTEQVIETKDFNNYISEDGITLNFDITTTENLNELIMSGSYISGTVPELNGYKPLSVKISGANITYTYNEATSEFTAQKEAILNGEGIVTSNAYTSSFTSSSSNTKKTVFDFEVVYPIEAYQEMGEDVTSIELAIPVQAINKGYNNPNEEDGFEPIYQSNTAEGIVIATFNITRKNPSFSIYVGSYMGNPYYKYVISKEKPINIYNGISLEEADDTYLVQWRAYTGENGASDGIIMEETPGKTDSFLNTSNTYISMEEFTSNKGIYFTGATETLGKDGWIKVYDADTNTLLETFTSGNWSAYSKSDPYIYENKVKHIKIETSETKEARNFYVNNIKELDDEYITENFTRAEFDKFEYVYSYLDGYMIEPNSETNSYLYSASVSNNALYKAPTSIASIAIKENTISTKATAENEIITIKTETSGYNEQKWKDGIFFVKLPSDIIYAEINNVKIDNSEVKISAYDVYEENGNYYIKILTESDTEQTYSISIDCDLTPDPRIPKKTDKIELYAINKSANDYYYYAEDVNDIDGDLNTTEYVNYRTTSLTIDPGTSLTTTQIGSNYGDGENITIAPRVAKTDKGQRVATITVFVTNNYNYDIKDIKIQGVIPFEGNDYIISGNDLESTFTTYMSETGISAVTDGISDYMTVYYSTAENPTDDLENSENGWMLADSVKDWSKIKTYLIVLDNSYSLGTGNTIEFNYDIQIPEGINYNEIAYSAHAVYFDLVTEEGLYNTYTASEKLGFMIAKQYDLEILKYQEDTNKTLQGITFTLTEEGQETSTIKVTNENGVINFVGLYAERYYILKEQSTIDDYVLNLEEVKFYTYTIANDDGTESLYLQFINEAENITIIGDSVVTSNYEDKVDYKFKLKIENQVKAKLAITKSDKDTGNNLKNIKFILTGEGKTREILSTDENGNIYVSGLYLEQEYTLEEVKATGYYIPQTPIKFKIIRENGEFKLIDYTDNGTTISNVITTDEEIPTINLNLKNEKIPTYGLQLTKYAKGETNKVLERAQYKVCGEGIEEEGKIYTTDENGILTIDGLYEYVEGKYITGEYTLTEIYAPEGYALNSTTLKFRTYRENGTLKIEIMDGQNVIRTITENETEEETVDLTIENATSTYPMIKIGVEDGPIFTLFKYTQDGTTTEKIPIAGTKFVITDLNKNYVTGSDGNIIGEWDDTLQKYVVTTDENGLLNANLPEGLYKAIEVYADDKYIFDENEANRTYYFGIGASRSVTWDWANGINGNGWEYVSSVVQTDDGGVIGIGSFSEYSSEVFTGARNGIDINNDGIIDKISQGSNDGIVISYDADGNYEWVKTFGGIDEDSLTKVVQTSDGGYALVGYTSSNTVIFDGNQELTDISKNEGNANLANKDAVLIKLDSSGNYEWGVRIGGTLDDEAQSVIETSEGNLVVVGTFYSSMMNFYEYNETNIQESFQNLNSNEDMYSSGMNSFIVSYSGTGKYQWSQRIGGNGDIEAVDVSETLAGINVAVNHIDTVYFDTEQTISQSGENSHTNATVVGYNLDGTYSWRYRLYPTEGTHNIAISSIDTTTSDNIVIGVNYAYSFNGSKNGETVTSIVNTKNNNTYDGAIIQLTNDGTYGKLLYQLSGNYDDYISDIVATADGGILLGGWYYSTDGIDVNGDGSTTGEHDLPARTDGYGKSDGFTIKIASSGQVEYASRIYGEGDKGVTTVAETKNGHLISGGYYNSTTLSATNLKIKNEEGEESETEVILNGNGNSEGFIIAEGATGIAVVPEAQSLEIKNEIKTFKITTEVKKHIENDIEVAGGDIDGEEGIFEGIEYSKEGIRYVESVVYEEDSTKNIKISPDEGYIISYIKINDIEYNNFIIANDGTVTIPVFEKVTEDIHIVVEFSNTASNIEVNHYLWNQDTGVTTTKIAESEYYTGDVGTIYTTLPKTEIDYEIITNQDYYGTNLPDGIIAEDYYIPTNYTGTYISGEKQIINYYYKEKTYVLTVHHYIEGTNQSVPLKDAADGEVVPDEITPDLEKGYKYETTQASERLIDYSIYEQVGVPENATGIIENNTEVTYYYKIKTANINITKVAEENHEMTLSGTEFTLYKYEGGVNNSIKNEVIDITAVDPCWTEVGKYTSSSTGIIKLEDLKITDEYRLIETKASVDRMIADGQWQIEFIYGTNNEEDASIITVGENKLKITAIGNPPALAITEDGQLQIPNREYFDMPTSGDIGTTIFYQIGMVILSIGMIILVIRKKLLINQNKKRKGRK